MQILRFAQNDRLLRERSEESRLILALAIWRDALRDCPSPSFTIMSSGDRESAIANRPSSKSPIEPRSKLA